MLVLTNSGLLSQSVEDAQFQELNVILGTCAQFSRLNTNIFYLLSTDLNLILHHSMRVIFERNLFLVKLNL